MAKAFKLSSASWRIIGGILMIVGIVLIVLLPTSTYPDAVVYRMFDDKGNVTRLFSIWHLLVIVGALALVPSLKDWSVQMFGKRKPKDENNEAESN